MTDRNALRAKLPASPAYRKAAVEIDGDTVYIREPSVGESRDLATKCKSKAGEIDQLEYALRAVLAPQPVAGSIVGKLTGAFAELIGGTADQGKD